ncbi:hypothetical protein ACIBCH_36695 [Amycolatopsis thailandensis]|uniref:hypothetical protein n=1 Tax=Amycolatopsis thailandensis TaxID=589330 RepID=UPI00378A9A30
MTIVDPYEQDYAAADTWAVEDDHVYDLDEVEKGTQIVGTLGGQQAEAEAPDTWVPLDLGPYLRGEIQPAVPELGVVDSNGHRLLYPGKEHSVIGEMESGKGWFACASAHAEIRSRRHVIYLHFEEADPSDTIGRLIALGNTAEEITTYLHFVGPMRPMRVDDLARLIAYGPSVVIIDGVNEAMSLHSLAIREEDGAATFRRRLVKPFTATGSAVMTCDHVIKDKEGRGRYALGSVHKGNAIDGAIFLLENAEPFGRGMKGRSHVFVTKDRPGHLRKHGRPTKIPGKTLIAELVVDDATYDDGLDLEVFAVGPDVTAPLKVSPDGKAVDELLCRRILDVITDKGGSLPSQRQVAAALREVGHGAQAIRVNAALDNLVLAGRLEEISHGASKEYRLTPGGDSQDQHSSVDSTPP